MENRPHQPDRTGLPMDVAYHLGITRKVVLSNNEQDAVILTGTTNWSSHQA